MLLRLQKNYSDKQLINALQQGDVAAFNKIYELFWYRLFLVAYQRLRQKEVARELVQNLFMKLWEKRESLIIDDLNGYLYGAMKYAVIDYIRSQLVANKYIQHRTTAQNGIEETTERMVAFDDISEALEEGIMKLPEKCQQVFRLSRLNNWPTDKIASHLNLSEKTVQYHLTKSLKFLRRYLREFTCSLLICLFQS